MTVFNEYSKVYDLLYGDKDYASEGAYVHNMIKKYNPNARTILNLGCGTGSHDLILQEFGYSCVGVDFSETMLARAQEKAELRSTHNLEFVHGDVRSIRLSKKFDAVISLFHVLSYQTSNEDISAVFVTADEHLQRNGIFVFDCWYGPAVLSDRPAVRLKQFEDDTIHVTRIAEPKMFPNANLVEIHYTLFVKDKRVDHLAELHEVHRMRYMFFPELRHYLERSGFALLSSAEWMTGRELDFTTWGACFVCRKS